MARKEKQMYKSYVKYLKDDAAGRSLPWTIAPLGHLPTSDVRQVLGEAVSQGDRDTIDLCRAWLAARKRYGRKSSCDVCSTILRPLGKSARGEILCARCMREITREADWLVEPSDWHE